jgi:hypothetical protein
MKDDDKSKFRTEVMELLRSFMDIMTPNGHAYKLWEKHFKDMSDDEFVKEVKAILDHPKRYFTVEIEPFNKSGEPKFRDFKKLAKLVDIELDEYVAMPHLNEHLANTTPVITPTKIPVGLLSLKRLQQSIRKKNKFTTSIEERDMRQGQVVRHDKAARVSKSDMYALSVIGAHPVLKELYGPRADGMNRKDAMYAAIRNGESLPRMVDFPYAPADHIALNTLDVYFMGASIFTDLTKSADTYVLPSTEKQVHSGKIKET